MWLETKDHLNAERIGMDSSMADPLSATHMPDHVCPTVNFDPETDSK